MEDAFEFNRDMSYVSYVTVRNVFFSRESVFAFY